jgi:hypothetical protein
MAAIAKSSTLESEKLRIDFMTSSPFQVVESGHTGACAGKRRSRGFRWDDEVKDYRVEQQG